MKSESPNAEETYALAYQAHYTDGDMLEALRQYTALFTHYPNSQRARDARRQIRTITSRLATSREVVVSDLSLAIAHAAEEVPTWFQKMIGSRAHARVGQGEPVEPLE